jgi:hypothetical protein
MLTECSRDLGFAPVEGREVVATFDGGAIASDAGALPLGATDRARRADRIEHEVVTWWVNGYSRVRRAQGHSFAEFG